MMTELPEEIFWEGHAMTMTDSEITRSYNEAKDKKAQIQVLADLNCMKATEMRQHLVDLGLDPPPLRGGGRKEAPGTGAPAAGLAELLGELCKTYPESKIRAGSGEVTGVTMVVRYLLDGSIDWTEIRLDTCAARGGSGK